MIGKLTKNTFVLLFLAARASALYDVPVGDSCTIDNQCETEYCDDTEKCALIPVGSFCYIGEQCETEYCDDTEKCALKSLGVFCRFDDQCESNNCFDNLDQGTICAPAPPTDAPTQAPTQAPTTQAPTATLAAPRSFEIHSTGNVTGTAKSGSSIEILATYNASNRVHNTTVLSPDCITSFPPSVQEAFTVTTTEPMSLSGGFIAYNSTIEVDISKVNTTDSWKPLSDGVVGGVLDLCLESAIYFALPDGLEKMNFVNTNLTLTVEMDANFEVTTINAERKDAKQEEVRVDYSEYVEAYECNDSDLVNKANNQEYSQGDELKVCVKSKNPSIVQVDGIQRLALSQDVDTTNDDFTYITGGSPVSSELAATTCDKTITPAYVCHADMQLLGRYFEDESPGDLTATGSVKLSFPDGSRRLTVDVPIASGIRGGDLALENSARRMGEEPEDGPFDVTVSLKSLVESGSDYYGVSLVSGLVAAAGGAILMV